MKTLKYEEQNNSIVLKKSGEVIRYTNVNYLPDGWQGLEGETLAQWGLENGNLIDRFAILPFILFLEEEKVEVYHTNNGEYKIVYNGKIAGFTSHREAQIHLNQLLETLGREGVELEENSTYIPGTRGSRLVLEINL